MRGRIAHFEPYSLRKSEHERGFRLPLYRRCQLLFWKRRDRFFQPFHEMLCLTAARPLYLYDIPIVAVQKPIRRYQSTGFYVSRNQMPWCYCGTETTQRSLDGEVIVIKSSGCEGYGLLILPLETRPLVPDARACSRFQSR